MGDIRFAQAYRAVADAPDRGAVLRRLSDEEVVGALAGACDDGDPYVVNLLATEAMNRVRRTAVVFGHMAEGVIILDPEGRIRHINPAGERLLGWPAGELRGRVFHEVVDHQHSLRSDRLDPEFLETVPPDRCHVLRVLETRAPLHEMDHDVFHRRDGSRFIVSFTAAPVLREAHTDGIIVVFRDDTEAVMEKDRLRLFKAALDLAPMAVFWLRRDGSFKYVNRRAAEHLETSVDKLQAQTVFDIDDQFDADGWAAWWEETKRKGRVRFQATHRTATGRRVPVHLDVYFVQQDSNEFHCAFARPLDD